MFNSIDIKELHYYVFCLQKLKDLAITLGVSSTEWSMIVMCHVLQQGPMLRLQTCLQRAVLLVTIWCTSFPQLPCPTPQERPQLPVTLQKKLSKTEMLTLVLSLKTFVVKKVLYTLDILNSFRWEDVFITVVKCIWCYLKINSII